MASDETTLAAENVPSTPVVSSTPVIDGYDVQGLLGRGGMGRVYQARDRKLGRWVAIKMLIDAGDEKQVARFHAESQAVARLQHPNIAQVFETGAIDGQPFLILEYIDGGSLAQRLAGMPQPARETATLLETLARAIDYSHQNGILHRDLKPANILLQSIGDSYANADLAAVAPIPKITDFGLAKRLHDDSKITRTGEVLGTPSYMAPEQAAGVAQTLGPAVDVYALGAILYEMLTGRPPFQGPDTLQTLMMVLTMDPVPPTRLQPGLPRDLETICLKCLEKSPRKRYATAAALADDLRRYLDGHPILARPVGVLERSLKWAKRRPMAAAFLALLAASVLGLILGFLHIRSTNLKLQISIGESNESAQITRLAIDDMVRLSDQLVPTPQSEQIRRETLEIARKLYEKLAAIRPRDHEGRSQAADALGKLGEIYGALGRLDDSESAYRGALAMHRELYAERPSVADHRRGIANTLLNLANLEQKRGRFAEGETLARSALAEIEPILEPPDAVTLRGASAMHTALALALRARARDAKRPPDDAERAHKEALALRKQWLALEPRSNDAKAALASSLSNLAALVMEARPAEAAATLAEAEALLAGQTAPQQRFFLGQFQANRALAEELLGNDKEAERAHAQAIATLSALVADYSSVPGYQHLLAREHMNLARYLAPRQRSEDALNHFQTAARSLDRLVQEVPENQAFRTDRDLCRKFIGWVEEDLAVRKKKTP